MTTGIIMAAARRAERRIVTHLREANATSYVKAQSLSNLRFVEEKRLKRLLLAGAVQEAAPGTYYLDETALSEYSGKRRKRVLILLSATFLGMAGLLGLSRK